MPFLRKISRCGLFFAAGERVGGDVVDRPSGSSFMRRDVVGEATRLRRRRWWSKRSAAAWRCRSRLAASSPMPSFSTWPNSFQNVAYSSLRFSARSSSMRQHALGRAFADRLHVAAFLQDLARDVQRQVGRIDHALDEAQVGRHQLLGVVHDEDALDVQLDAGALLAVPQVERRARRHVQQLRVFAAALDAVVRVGQRSLEVVRRRACRTPGTARR